MKTTSIINMFILRVIMILSGGFFLCAAIMEVNASAHNGAAKAAAAATPEDSSIKDPLKNIQNILVRLDANGQLVPYTFPNEGKDIEYIVFYFSSGACPHCREFGPRLIQSYKTIKSRSNNFEMVLVDYDHSEIDMINYMKQYNMPFPALQYDLRKQANITQQYRGISLPALVIVDRQGKVRSTNANSELRTADDVLIDLSRLAHD